MDFVPYNDNTFQINNTQYGFINCGSNEGHLCNTGYQFQRFRPEFRGGRSYEIVDVNSGFFICANENMELYVSGWDQSLNEQFVLTEVVLECVR